ncbi:DoxX family protein [Methylotenera versatilis]|uniref:DoxX family protein n=1 Tax=Methylotenera versatilis TaxID=1055487 RepID=UPI0006454B51|nr:DoxX family protein [Methylotenera versatilis]
MLKNNLNFQSTNSNKLKIAARILVTAWFIIGGIMHFANPEPFLRMMPSYIPYHLACIYISGALELLGSIGLWIKPVRSLAGYGLMTLTAILTLTNIYMAQHANLFPGIPEWLLILRLPVQAVLIWLIWWCSRPEKNYYFA